MTGTERTMIKQQLLLLKQNLGRAAKGWKQAKGTTKRMYADRINRLGATYKQLLNKLNEEV